MMRTFNFGSDLRGKWTAVRQILKKIWWRKVQINVPKRAIKPPRPIFQSKYFGVFRNTVPRTLSTSFVNSRTLLTSQADLKHNFQPITGPKFQLFVSRVFQFGFIGLVYTHQQYGNGFVAAQSLRLDDFSFFEVFKKEAMKENAEDPESDIIILEDDSLLEHKECPKEEVSTMLYAEEDIHKFAELSVVMHNKLEQLHSLLETFETEQAKGREKIADSQRREEGLKTKIEQLERENNDLKGKMKMILQQVKTFTRELTEKHTQALIENSRIYDLLGGSCSDDAVEDITIKTFVEKDKNSWVLLN